MTGEAVPGYGNHERQPFTRTTMSPIRTLPLALLLLAACGRAGTDPAAAADTPTSPAVSGAAGGTMLASSASLLGRWEKVERTLPPVTLELRADAADRVTGQVWLSGVTYQSPVTLSDSGFTLGAGRPTMRGTLVADRRLRVQFLDANGRAEHEETLVKMQ